MNPLFPGCYADPEIHWFSGRYYIYPTTSKEYHEQTYFECWSSADLKVWKNEGRILDLSKIPWSTNYAAWAPSVAEKNGRYYFYFSTGDGAGIGVAAADTPTGPFHDALGIPLVSGYPLGAQPIDPHCFVDDDGKAYLLFGGQGRCVIAPLAPTMLAFSRAYRDITPSGEYVEGPFLIKRKGVYYLMWSEGNWGDGTYRAAYGVADNPYGPFEFRGHILENDPSLANGPGHHSVLQLPDRTDEWVVCYHRRPLGVADPNNREVCLDDLKFSEGGSIQAVVMH